MKIVSGIKPVADALAGTVTSDYVSLGKYQKLLALLDIAVGATGTTTLTVQCASDSSGTGAEAVAFKYRRCSSGDTLGSITDATSAGFTTTAGSNQFYVLEIEAADCPADKPWVAIKGVEVVDSPVLAGLTMFLAGPRYGGATLPTAIA